MSETVKRESYILVNIVSFIIDAELNRLNILCEISQEITLRRPERTRLL